MTSLTLNAITRMRYLAVLNPIQNAEDSLGIGSLDTN